MEAVLDVYERPYNENCPVVCLDESPKQLLSEIKTPYEDEKGNRYIDYEYKREGTADIYMITEPLGGRREVLIKENHNRISYAETLAHIAEKMYPHSEKITLIEDNLRAHKFSAVYELFDPERARRIVQKFELVRTPKHGSWLNIAECELSVLIRQGIAQRVPNMEELKSQVEAWYSNRNASQTKVDWQFTSKKARVKLKRLYPTILT